MRLRTLAGISTGLGALAGVYLGVATGRLHVDLGIGRRTFPLGPLEVEIAAPPGVVFAAAAAPYAERRPRTMEQKVRILHRGVDMVLAEHRTVVNDYLTTITVETVRLEPPARIEFRLVRGPVPHVTETFEFTPTETGTTLTYTGELGTDFGALGERWAKIVSGPWVSTVADSLATIKAESERRNH